MKIDPDDSISHVYPTFGREHDVDSTLLPIDYKPWRYSRCWCCPTIEPVMGRFIATNGGAQVIGFVVIHRVMN